MLNRNTKVILLTVGLIWIYEKRHSINKWIFSKAEMLKRNV